MPECRDTTGTIVLVMTVDQLAGITEMIGNPAGTKTGTADHLATTMTGGLVEEMMIEAIARGQVTTNFHAALETNEADIETVVAVITTVVHLVLVPGVWMEVQEGSENERGLLYGPKSRLRISQTLHL